MVKITGFKTRDVRFPVRKQQQNYRGIAHPLMLYAC